MKIGRITGYGETLAGQSIEQYVENKLDGG